MLQNNPTLTSSVEKNARSEYGIFVNILNDLAKLSEDDHNIHPKIKMAYMYARRTVVGGLYLQGVVTAEDAKYTQGIFQNCQQETGSTKEFQIEASEQALEHLMSYDSRFTSPLMTLLTEACLEPDSFATPDGGMYSPEELIENCLKIIRDNE